MSVFSRHPRWTLATLASLGMLATDLAFTKVYVWTADRLAAGRPKYRIKSAVYHHGLAPLMSLEDERWGGRRYTYCTNSLGFRDRAPRQVAVKGERPRFLFMGDSFTEGIGVNYEASFVGIVDAAWAARGIEILNAAVSLYSPAIYFHKTKALIEDLGLRFDEMVVFLDISDIQDEVTYQLDTNGAVTFDLQRRRLEAKANWRYSDGFWCLHRCERLLDDHTLVGIRIYRLIERPFANPRRRGAAWTFDPRVFEEYGREGLERARAHMDALRKLLQERNINLTIAVYPWPDQILERDLNSRQVRFWRAWAAENGVGFINLFPVFIGREDATAVVERAFIKGDIHWNETGHRMVAEAFLRDYRMRPRTPSAE